MASLIGTMQLDAGAVRDEHFSNQSAHRLDADKMQHVYSQLETFNKLSTDTPVSCTIVHRSIRVSGTVRKFCAGLVAVGSSTSITVDLKKNGTTILSSPITLTNAGTNRAAVEGTISSGTVAAGDLLEITVTVTSATGATGLFAQTDVEETGAP